MRHPSTESKTLDLTLHGPITDSSSLVPCGVENLKQSFKKLDSMFKALHCGGCSKPELQTTVQVDTPCPRCNTQALRDVGGWI